MPTNELQLDERQYYTFTNYPLIFMNCYWGKHKYNVENIIIENRNNFVEKYDISSYKDTRNMSQIMKKKTFIFHDGYYNKIAPPKDIHKQGFVWNAGMSKDHIEYYTIRGKKEKSFIAIFSQRKEDNKHDLILAHGYIEVPPLYATEQTTYIKIIHPDTL